MTFPRFVILFFLLLAALVSNTSNAFAGNPNHYRYTTRDGLAGDYITAITLAPDGSAWIGTSEGATHIEKNRWTSYTRAHGLGDSWITAIAIAPDGKIWFGTQSGGVSVFDPSAKTITTYNLDNSEIPSNFVTTVTIDSKNRAWIGTLNNGIALFEPSSNNWTRYLANSEINSFAWGDEETPWALANGQIHFFDETQWVQNEWRGAGQVKRLYNASDNLSRALFAETENQIFVSNGGEWIALPESNAPLVQDFPLQQNQVTALAQDKNAIGGWLGTANGLYAINTWLMPPLEKPLPVLLIHGWTVAGDDTLETSEFRFLKSYADRDGIPMYYVRGVSPKNTLYQNAAVIRDEIAGVKKETGADKVNIVAFSMGGMNTRAYLESSLYANDVQRAIILGTPQAGVDIWKPILAQQILEKFDEPSAIELSPEYARLIVNSTRAPNSQVPYDYLIGDARTQTGLDFLDDMPASDALISVHSALALDAPNVRKHINADLHDWGPEPVPIDLTGYLYPRVTWERYLRNALRNNDDAPIGSEILPMNDGSAIVGKVGEQLGESGNIAPRANHTPVITKKINAGETLTTTVLLDANNSARFIAYYPGGEIDFSLVAPDGKKIEPSDLPRDENGVLTLSTDIASFSGYVVKNATIGEWQLIVTRTDTRNDSVNVSTYVELDSPIRLEALPNWSSAVRGETIQLRALVRANWRAAPTESELLRDVKIRARVAVPSESPGARFTFTEIEFYDDGRAAGDEANDGLFVSDYLAPRGGWYLVSVQAEGKNFVRADEILLPISPNDARIARDSALTLEKGLLKFNGQVNVTRAGAYVLSVELREPTTGAHIANLNLVKTLSVGANPISIVFDVSRFASTKFDFFMKVLDSNWAAVELDHATFAAP